MSHISLYQSALFSRLVFQRICGRSTAAWFLPTRNSPSPRQMRAQRRLLGSPSAVVAQLSLESEAAAPAAAPPTARAPPSQQQQQQRLLATQHPHPHAHGHGSIELLVGPMFAGKTTALLQRVAEFEAAGLRVAVVKSSKDDRYCAGHVVTHDGQRRSAYSVPSLAAFRDAAGAAYAGYHVIAVDEAQFFPDLRDFSLKAADVEAKHVVLAGLDGDFQRQRFGQVLDMLPLADSVTKLHATCTFCQQEAGPGRPAARALFSLRIAADERQEVVGGADKYAPVCRKHYVSLSGLRGAAAAEEEDCEGEEAASA